MKKIIRTGVYETNSSSSHALSIGGRKQRYLDTFPRNSEYIYYLAEYGVTCSDEISLDLARLYSEVDKAKFILNILASHIEEEDERYPDTAYWLDWENRIQNPNRSFELLIAQKPFVWLKELLEEQTGTKFEFEQPHDNDFPYYRTAYDDNYGLDDVVNINWYDEKKFKERMSEIIFNPDIIIIDADIPYGCDVDINDF